MMELFELTSHELHAKLAKKDVSAEEITRSFLTRISKVEDKISAFMSINVNEAVSRAKQIDDQIANGADIGPLTGIPVAIKDNLCTKGRITTCSSKILEGYLPPYNATVVENILKAGAIPIGKTNLDEFAMGSSTENSAYKTTKNPWDISRVPGGSSGGSAACVAAGEAPIAFGSDTGGSIRQPAAFCGVTGLKPTYGRVSRFGLIAFASSLDQIGPLTKDVTDAAIFMNVMSGYDPKDSTSVNMPVPDYRKSLVNDIKGLKVGIIKELLGEGIEAPVKKAILDAAEVLKKLGAKIEEISLPSLQYGVATYYILATAEASSNLERYDGVKYGHRSKDAHDLLSMYYNTRSEGFGPEVKRRIMLGTYALSSGYYDAYYLKAQKVRTLIKNDYDKAFSKFDVLISTTTPSPAFKVGEKANDPLSMYLSDIATIPINLAGIPAISIPCGYVNDMPVGLQIMGKAFSEETLLRVAYTYEQNTLWHKQRAKL
jgi:aspartyl-tRNA(Asn)/glutamyl-tRNA(Gln) amidotransferase subunit A